MLPWIQCFTINGTVSWFRYTNYIENNDSWKKNGVGVNFCNCATILSEVLKLCNDLLLICYLLSEVLQLCNDLLFVRTKKYKILTVWSAWRNCLSPVMSGPVLRLGRCCVELLQFAPNKLIDQGVVAKLTAKSISVSWNISSNSSRDLIKNIY